ncbi:hypothetical protein P692DRAFT_20761460 [Suillus brevipes Sb2]|nr:hypothetical protein P692DRAFT_20761460 [Suillus brevipes Sb2]
MQAISPSSFTTGFPTFTDRTTPFRNTSRPISQTTRTNPRSKRRARSLSLSEASAHSSSDDSINGPVTPPPIIRHLSRYVQHETHRYKPYRRDGPTTLDCRNAASQLVPNDSMTLADVQKGKKSLQRRLQNLSSQAVAQAVVTKEADVEWRRLRALTTAWEIHAIEQHQKFLYMVFEDDSQIYTSAASEPLITSIQEFSNSNMENLQRRIEDCRATFGPDAMSFAVADSQLDLVEDIACVHFGDDSEDHSSVGGSKSLCRVPLISSQFDQ